VGVGRARLFVRQLVGFGGVLRVETVGVGVWRLVGSVERVAEDERGIRWLYRRRLCLSNVRLAHSYRQLLIASCTRKVRVRDLQIVTLLVKVSIHRASPRPARDAVVACSPRRSTLVHLLVSHARSEGQERPGLKVVARMRRVKCEGSRAAEDGGREERHRVVVQVAHSRFWWCVERDLEQSRWCEGERRRPDRDHTHMRMRRHFSFHSDHPTRDRDRRAREVLRELLDGLDREEERVRTCVRRR
jgi:hypothetical protein